VQKTAKLSSTATKSCENIGPRDVLPLKELENFKILEDPLHTTILEMTTLREFECAPAWIQKRLAEKKSLKAIESALERLFHAGLLQKQSDNRIEKTFTSISSRKDIKDEAVQSHHRRVLQLAELGLRGPVNHRQYNAMALSLRKNDLAEAKEMIRTFVREIVNTFEVADHNGEETYQLAVQFFSLTKGRDRE